MWSAPKLSDLYGFKRTNALARDKLNYETGTIRNIHYGDIHTKFKPLFSAGDECLPFINPDASINGFDDGAFCDQGDIVLADASEGIDDVGKAIEIVALDGECVVAGMHTILAARRGSHPVVGFGGHLFQSAAVRAGIKKEAQGAKVYGISANRISTVQVPIPPTVDEQQKIAECLTSIDDLITAEAQKINALKTHKKGLMQQLFPCKGEVIPRLRFPEFRDAEGWKKKQLGDILSVGNGRDHKHLANGNIPVYGSGGYMRSVNEYLYDGESVCIGRKGTINNPIFLSGKFWTVDTLFYTHSYIDCFPFFAYVIFQNINWLDHNEAGGIPSLSKANIEKIDVAVPTLPEQQKIAACLTSIDDLITAKAQKIDALKTHKKGLMQQLFPTSDEVNV